jgi:hypothetical protein
MLTETVDANRRHAPLLSTAIAVNRAICSLALDVKTPMICVR